MDKDFRLIPRSANALNSESQVHTLAQRSPTGLNKGLNIESRVHTIAQRSPTGLNKGLKVESRVHTVAQRSPTGLNKGLKVESRVHTVAQRSPTGLNKGLKVQSRVDTASTQMWSTGFNRGLKFESCGSPRNQVYGYYKGHQYCPDQKLLYILVLVSPPHQPHTLCFSLLQVLQVPLSLDRVNIAIM